jgi:hypothetical protein
VFSLVVGCAYIFELVGCVLSCCGLCVFVFELVGCVLSCCVLCAYVFELVGWLVVFSLVVCCAYMCLSWWVVFPLVVCCGACLFLECFFRTLFPSLCKVVYLVRIWSNTGFSAVVLYYITYIVVHIFTINISPGKCNLSYGRSDLNINSL